MTSCHAEVHPMGGSLRVFKPFVWLRVGSVKVALSRPTHQWVTRAVGRLHEGIKYGANDD
jgi:hypothetical protein